MVIKIRIEEELTVLEDETELSYILKQIEAVLKQSVIQCGDETVLISAAGAPVGNLVIEDE